MPQFRTGEPLLGVPAVVLDVWFRPQEVGDLLLRARRNGLVDLELRDGRLIRAGNVLLRGVARCGQTRRSSGRNIPAYADSAAAEPQGAKESAPRQG